MSAANTDSNGLAGVGVAEGPHTRGDALVRGRVFARKPVHHDVEIRRGLFERDLSGHPAECVDVPYAAVRRRRAPTNRKGLPERGQRREAEAFRHDAYHRGRNAVHAHGAADDIRVALIAALPDRMAEDDHRCGAWRLVGGREVPAEKRAQAEQREAVRRDVRPDVALGRPPLVGDVHRHLVHRADPVEQPGRGLKIPYLGKREVVEAALAAACRARSDHDDAIGIREGQVAQEHPVPEREDRAGGRDAERQREDGRDGESAILRQQPGGEPEVVPHSHEVTSNHTACRKYRRNVADSWNVEPRRRPLAGTTVPEPDKRSPGCGSRAPRHPPTRRPAAISHRASMARSTPACTAEISESS